MLSELERNRLWRIYITNVRNGVQSSLEAAGVYVLSSSRERSFVSTTKAFESFKLLESLIELWERLEQERQERLTRKSNVMFSRELQFLESTKPAERKIFELCLDFFDSVNNNKSIKPFEEFMGASFPINFQHPITGDTIAHIAARQKSDNLTEYATSHPNCNLLLLNNQQMMPFDIAKFWFLQDEVLVQAFYFPTIDQLVEKFKRDGGGDYTGEDWDVYNSDLKRREGIWHASDWFKEEVRQGFYKRDYVTRWQELPDPPPDDILWEGQ